MRLLIIITLVPNKTTKHKLAPINEYNTIFPALGNAVTAGSCNLIFGVISESFFCVLLVL
jgi:hypothetical protein